MGRFSASEYLVSQGWEGQGKGLRNGSRARPISVVQKKTFAGIGKDTYNAFPFWENLFDAMAKKLATSDTTTVQQKTKTGILSPLAPTGPPKGEAVSTALAKHDDVVQSLAQQAAKAQLYRSFLRGQVIEGNVEEEVKAQSDPVSSQPVAIDTSSTKSKKRRRIVDDNGSEREETKEERKKRRLAKKLARSTTQTAETEKPKHKKSKTHT